MDQNCTIEIEVHRNLMRITLGGFFEAEKLPSVLDQLKRAQGQLRRSPDRHLTLVDVRAMAIQPQESISLFERIIAEPGPSARRLAFVVPHTLVRMQVKRAASSRDAAFFDDVGSAEKWLFST